MKILCIGEEWKGSNASGLFFALSRVGCVVNIVNELKYVSVYASSFQTKFLNRVIRSFQVRDLNEQLKSITRSFRPDLILVYKGAYILPETIHFWKNLKLPVVNFFPDVSFLAHGKNIPACIPLYDHIFTTKTFAAHDLHVNFGYDPAKVSFIPHGFDPLIHRRMTHIGSSFVCDASFIGNFSGHKESYLSLLVKRLPQIDLKIWGSTWVKSSTSELKKYIQNVGIVGDLYALALNASCINIGLLSEQVVGASSGDKITSRTFHIPGSGGFMLHQRTDEVLQYFEEGKEMACFSSAEEMADKVKYYQNHEAERKLIQEAGYLRAQRSYSLDVRAEQFLTILKQKEIH